MKRIAAVLMMVPALALADGPWTINGPLAEYQTDAGVTVSIGFVPDETGQCPSTGLSLIGNAHVVEIGFCTDKQCFDPQPVTIKRALHGETPVSILMIPEAARDALAYGNIVQIQTNAGILDISLEGSFKAMDAAYDNCARMAHQKLRLQGQMPGQTEEPEEPEFRVYKEGEML